MELFIYFEIFIYCVACRHYHTLSEAYLEPYQTSMMELICENNELLIEAVNKVFKDGPSKICGREPLKKCDMIW